MFLSKEEIEEEIKDGYIRPFEQAFIDSPVEDEWHKGLFENVICEDNSDYPSFEIGDIVYSRNYVYKNGAKGTKHFFVIVDDHNIAIPFDYYGMIVSSRLDKLKYGANVLLKKDTANHLDYDSIVKTDYLYLLKRQDIDYKIGTVAPTTITEYLNRHKVFKESQKNNTSD